LVMIRRKARLLIPVTGINMVIKANLIGNKRSFKIKSTQ
jgi:hypothetical protein